MALNNFSVVVILAVLAVACTSTKAHSHDRGLMRPPVVQPAVFGGISEASVRSPGFKRVDAYVRRLHPELRGYKVTNVRSQVVAGTKWYITYSTGPRRYDAEVLDRPWSHSIKVLSFKQQLARF